MTNLVQAYNGACSTLKPQKQGTCGLYSFWYASLLLAAVNPGAKKPIIYPRSGEGVGTAGESLRHFVKHTVNPISSVGGSQGEVLSLCGDGAGHRQVRLQLRQPYRRSRPAGVHHPVAGRQPPCDVPLYDGRQRPDLRVPGRINGRRRLWPALVADLPGIRGGLLLHRAERSQPRRLAPEGRRPALQFVRRPYKYDRFWSKGGNTNKKGQLLPYEARSGISPIGNAPTTGAYYDIGDKSRQSLNNVLIAVY